MDAADRELFDTFSRFMRLCLEEADQASGEGPGLAETLREHLSATLTDLPVSSLDVAATEFVNLDVAVEHLVRNHGGGRLVGVGGGDERHHRSFADMYSNRFGREQPLGPVDRVRMETGVDSHRDAVSFGLHLFRFGGDPVALLQRRSNPRFGQQSACEVLATRDTAEALLAQLRDLMMQHNVFRGQLLEVSEVGGQYEPSASNFTFLERPAIAAAEVVLPAGSLDRVERHIVGTARHRETLRAAGQHLKRGLLLYGPPGTGKTHSVRYLLGQLDGVTCFLLSGNAMGYLSPVTTLAQALQPSLIVLEDVDLIAEERGLHGPQPLLFSLLDAMDGLSGDADVAFVLTTNRADLLEQALTQRPGRVDLALEVPLPDQAARLLLLSLYARALPLSQAALTTAAEQTDGVTASFFKELARRTVLVAATQEQPVDDAIFAQVLAEMQSDSETLTRRLLGGEHGGAAAS